MMGLRPRKGQKVYFIKPIGMDGPIKIGCSQSPDKRRSALETWSPFPLEIIAEIEGGEKLERRFHAKFTAQHKSREWFRVSAELLATVDAINAGTFDIEALPEPRRLHHGGNTGPKPGAKWSEERKAQARICRAITKAEKLSGLVRPFNWSGAAGDFIADPYKHGVTREQWQADRDVFWTAYMAKRLAA